MNTLGNLLDTVKIPFAASPIKWEITVLSEALTTHHARLLGINGREYLRTLLNMLYFADYTEKYLQHLELDIK